MALSKDHSSAGLRRRDRHDFSVGWWSSVVILGWVGPGSLFVALQQLGTRWELSVISQFQVLCVWGAASAALCAGCRDSTSSSGARFLAVSPQRCSGQ